MSEKNWQALQPCLKRLPNITAMSEKIWQTLQPCLKKFGKHYNHV